jgi:hypothetical protein
MEVYIRDRHAVRLALRLGNQTIDSEDILLHLLRDFKGADDPLDVREVGVVMMMVGVVVMVVIIVIMVMVVIMIIVVVVVVLMVMVIVIVVMVVVVIFLTLLDSIDLNGDMRPRDATLHGCLPMHSHIGDSGPAQPLQEVIPLRQ